MTLIEFRLHCSPIKNQHDIKCSPSCAVTSLYDFRFNVVTAKKCKLSSLFNYKATRNLAQISGNLPCSINSSMSACVLLGSVPERYWPFIISKYDDEPSAFCYALARNFRTMQPLPLEWPNIPRDYLLDQIKSMLRNKFALCFGFTASKECFAHVENDGIISIPQKSEKMLPEGMAALAVGYDDSIKILNRDNETNYGAVLFQASLGEKWGDNGFGWLPYEYVLSKRANEWWTMTDYSFTDLEEYGMSNS